MSLVTRLLGWPKGQSLRSDLRARLSASGVDFLLEERIQPAKATLSNGIGAQVREVARQIGVDHVVPPGPIVSAAAHAAKAARGGTGGSGDSGGGSVANASISGTAFVDWNGNSMIDSGENAVSGVLVTL